MQGLLQLQGMLRSCDPIIVVVDLTVSRRWAGWDKELYSQAGKFAQAWNTGGQEEANVTRVSSRRKKKGVSGSARVCSLEATYRPQTSGNVRVSVSNSTHPYPVYLLSCVVTILPV